MPFFNELKDKFVQVNVNAWVIVREIDGEIIVSVTIPSNELLVNNVVVTTAGETGTFLDNDYEPAPAVVTIVTDDALFRNP